MKLSIPHDYTDEEFIILQSIFHEINSEPGPSFSCYCVNENWQAGCVNCEIHCNGKGKPPIHVTKKQLEGCIHSQKGRIRLKEYLKQEIDDLAGAEEESSLSFFDSAPPQPI
jgi:hypothetical protein